MVKLRLRRVGKKKQPVYKIVAADSRSARTGKYIEAVGTYSPLNNPMGIEVNEHRLLSWLKNGAQPTDTVRSLLQRKGVWLKWSMMRRGVDDAKIIEAMDKWQLMQPEKLVRETEKKARRKSARKKAAAAPVVEAAPIPTE